MSVSVGAANSVRFILRHPLNKGRSLRTLVRYAAWQVGSRLVPGPIQVPFVDDACLVVGPGMTGATGNVYTGLHEFEDMAFLLHYLRREDLFVDIGANVGSYTVLASSVAGARSVAFEPLPEAFAGLRSNIEANGIDARVEARNEGLGSARGSIEFTADRDTQNRALSEDEHSGGGPNGVGATRTVPVTTLDSALAGRPAAMIKIDVEGYEPEVLAGAQATLEEPALNALILERNGAGSRYGFDELATHRDLLERGFRTYRYLPFERRLEALGAQDEGGTGGNTLYLRDVGFVRERLASAPQFSVCGRRL